MISAIQNGLCRKILAIGLAIFSFQYIHSQVPNYSLLFNPAPMGMAGIDKNIHANFTFEKFLTKTHSLTFSGLLQKTYKKKPGVPDFYFMGGDLGMQYYLSGKPQGIYVHPQFGLLLYSIIPSGLNKTFNGNVRTYGACLGNKWVWGWLNYYIEAGAGIQQGFYEYIPEYLMVASGSFYLDFNVGIGWGANKKGEFSGPVILR